MTDANLTFWALMTIDAGGAHQIVVSSHEPGQPARPMMTDDPRGRDMLKSVARRIVADKPGRRIGLFKFSSANMVWSTDDR